MSNCLCGHRTQGEKSKMHVFAQSPSWCLLSGRRNWSSAVSAGSRVNKCIALPPSRILLATSFMFFLFFTLLCFLLQTTNQQQIQSLLVSVLSVKFVHSPRGCGCVSVCLTDRLFSVVVYCLQEEEDLGRRQVLVLGLDGAGKSSMLQGLTPGEATATAKRRRCRPTRGFNFMSLNATSCQLDFLESKSLFFTPQLICVRRFRVVSSV